MGSKMIPTPALTTVCDLCDKPIDTYSNRDRACLNWGTTPLADNARPKPRHFLFFRRGAGGRSGAPAGDYRSWEWDFHGECLVAALEPLVFTRGAS